MPAEARGADSFRTGVTGSCPVWVLGTQMGASAGTASTRNCWAIALAYWVGSFKRRGTLLPCDIVCPSPPPSYAFPLKHPLLLKSSGPSFLPGMKHPGGNSDGHVKNQKPHSLAAPRWTVGFVAFAVLGHRLGCLCPVLGLQGPAGAALI